MLISMCMIGSSYIRIHQRAKLRYGYHFQFALAFNSNSQIQQNEFNILSNTWSNQRKENSYRRYLVEFRGIYPSLRFLEIVEAIQVYLFKQNKVRIYEGFYFIAPITKLHL